MKSIIRHYITQYGYRWDLMRYNNKNLSENLITPIDLFIKKNIKGSVLFLDILGFQYKNFLKNVCIKDELLGVSYGEINDRYDNLYLMNNSMFKYKSLSEIGELIKILFQKNCTTNGKIFLGFNQQFVKYNRLKFKFADIVEEWIDQLNTHGYFCEYKKYSVEPNPYGSCFFILTKI